VEHELIAAIATEGARLAALPVDALDRPVPSCPGWTVEDLVSHVGRVHRWAARHLAAAPGQPERGPRSDPPAGPSILDWYQASLDLLLAELDRHHPDEPVHSFIGPATAAFWARRQAHELAVHRWDADAALGDEPTPIAAPLAADGVDEWLSVFVPRFLARRDEPVPAELVGASVHLHGTDEGQTEPAEWLLRLTPDGAEVARVHAKGDAALRGPASDLLLAVWHRVPLERLDVVGDADRARAVLDLVHVS